MSAILKKEVDGSGAHAAAVRITNMYRDCYAHNKLSFWQAGYIRSINKEDRMDLRTVTSEKLQREFEAGYDFGEYFKLTSKQLVDNTSRIISFNRWLQYGAVCIPDETDADYVLILVITPIANAFVYMMEQTRRRNIQQTKIIPIVTHVLKSEPTASGSATSSKLVKPELVVKPEPKVELGDSNHLEAPSSHVHQAEFKPKHANTGDETVKLKVKFEVSTEYKNRKPSSLFAKIPGLTGFTEEMKTTFDKHFSIFAVNSIIPDFIRKLLSYYVHRPITAEGLIYLDQENLRQEINDDLAGIIQKKAIGCWESGFLSRLHDAEMDPNSKKGNFDDFKETKFEEVFGTRSAPLQLENRMREFAEGRDFANRLFLQQTGMFGVGDTEEKKSQREWRDAGAYIKELRVTNQTELRGPFTVCQVVTLNCINDWYHDLLKNFTDWSHRRRSEDGNPEEWIFEGYEKPSIVLKNQLCDTLTDADTKILDERFRVYTSRHLPTNEKYFGFSDEHDDDEEVDGSDEEPVVENEDYFNLNPDDINSGDSNLDDVWEDDFPPDLGEIYQPQPIDAQNPLKYEEHLLSEVLDYGRNVYVPRESDPKRPLCSTNNPVPINDSLTSEIPGSTPLSSDPSSQQPNTSSHQPNHSSRRPLASSTSVSSSHVNNRTLADPSTRSSVDPPTLTQAAPSKALSSSWFESWWKPNPSPAESSNLDKSPAFARTATDINYNTISEVRTLPTAAKNNVIRETQITNPTVRLTPAIASSPKLAAIQGFTNAVLKLSVVSDKSLKNNSFRALYIKPINVTNLPVLFRSETISNYDKLKSLSKLPKDATNWKSINKGVQLPCYVLGRCDGTEGTRAKDKLFMHGLFNTTTVSVVKGHDDFKCDDTTYTREELIVFSHQLNLTNAGNESNAVLCQRIRDRLRLIKT